jgi:hypothetical protein
MLAESVGLPAFDVLELQHDPQRYRHLGNQTRRSLLAADIGHQDTCWHPGVESGALPDMTD